MICSEILSLMQRPTCFGAADATVLLQSKNHPQDRHKSQRQTMNRDSECRPSSPPAESALDVESETCTEHKLSDANVKRTC